MLRPAEEAPGLTLGEGIRVGESVRFGSHVTVHDGTEIGDGCVVEDGAVLGKCPQLGPASTASRERPGPLVLEAEVTVCAGAVVYAGARVEEQAVVGDQAQVRERAVIGRESVVGRGSGVDNDVTVGNRVRLQSLVYLAAGTVVEDDVFVGPAATTTNDNTMARHPSDQRPQGAILRRACRVGAGAVLLPGVEVGEEAFVTAAAVVTRAVPPRAVVMGVPAREVRTVPDGDLLERWR